jgi:osmoprotectant transport system substrate-binding protein
MKISVKKLIALLLFFFVALSISLTDCPSEASDANSAGADKRKVIIGARDWAEPYIFAYLTGFALEDAGYTVDYRLDIADSSLLNDALVKGDFDITANYSGTLYESVLGHTPIFDREEEYKTIKKELKDRYNIVALDESNINNSYAMVVTKKTAEKYNIVKTSDLVKVSKQLTFADPGVFWQREKKRLQGLYGSEFDWKSANTFDKGLRYKALLNGEVDVTIAFTTDAELNDSNIFRITDDFPTYQPYYVIPLARQEILTKYPDIERIVNEIFARLTEKDTVNLNYQATVEKKDYDKIARAWYNANIKK